MHRQERVDEASNIELHSLRQILPSLAIWCCNGERWDGGGGEREMREGEMRGEGGKEGGGKGGRRRGREQCRDVQCHEL